MIQILTVKGWQTTMENIPSNDVERWKGMLNNRSVPYRIVIGYEVVFVNTAAKVKQ